MTSVDELTRGMVNRANRAIADEGADEPEQQNNVLSEVLTAELFDVRRVPDEADWYDCEHGRGTKYEVKAAQVTVDGLDEDRYVATAGRVRVWRSQLRSLLSASGADGQTAWVVFWLLSDDGAPLEVKRVQPSTVWSWVTDEMNGWDESGHANEDRDLQQKLPLGLVFDTVER